MNEEYQFACTCIFSFLLERLRRQPVAWTVTGDFVQDAVAATLLELEQLGLPFTSESTLADLRDVVADVKLTDGTEDQIALRLIQLLELQCDNTDLTKVSTFAPSGADGTEDVVGFLKDLDSWWNQPLSEYLHYFFRYDILERHRRVALDKLRGRNQSSEKFVMEGGRYIIRPLLVTGPGRGFHCSVKIRSLMLRCADFWTCYGESRWLPISIRLRRFAGLQEEDLACCLAYSVNICLIN